MQGRQVLPVSLSVRATVALPRAAVWCGAWGLWAVHRPCHGMCLQVENWRIWQKLPRNQGTPELLHKHAPWFAVKGSL